MPRNPEDYSSLLGKMIEKHKTNIFLVNTGWSGGPFGIGKRMDIKLTRKLVNAALNGDLNNVKYEEDPLFHLNIPKSCPGIPSNILFPKNIWEDKVAFDERAQRLANDFKTYFDDNYLGKVDPDIQKECPGY